MPNAPWGPINREGRNEFQLAIAIACTSMGIWQFATDKPPSALRDLSHTSQLLWAVLLTFGGTLVLVSAIGNKASGFVPFFEIGGLVTLGGAMLAYSAGVLLTVDFDSAISFALLLFSLVGVACLSRTARIVHALWPKRVSREEKLKQEVRKQMVAEAVKAADKIVDKSGHTGEIPVIFPVDGKGAE